MKRLLQALLLIGVLLVAVYFLAIDYVLKGLIEREGSRALAARLDVGHVTFHLLPASIRLEAVQVTNPQQPARNLVEFASLSTPLQLGALRERRLDIPELQIQGLRFNTTRAQSGAIAGVTPVGGASETAELPDSAQIALQQQQRLQDEMSKTRQDLTTILAKWRQHLQQLPDDSRIEEYRQRALQLRSAGQTAELAQLRQQLNSEVGKARQLAEEFELDMQNARAQLAYAQSAPQSAGSVAATPQVLNAMVGALLGAEFKPVLGTLVQQLDNVIRQASAQQDSPQLALLVRRASIDGQLDIGTQPLLFTGTVDNFTPQPRLWNVATSFTLAGVPSQPSQFSARGRADFRKTPNIDLRFDLRQFPLRTLPLSRNPQLAITIDSAVADIQGMLACTGNQVDVNLLSRFQQAKLDVQATTDNAAQTLKGALHDVTDFDVNLQISGSAAQPTLKFDSSLTPRLAAALGQQLQSGNAPGTQPGSELQQQLGGVQQLANDFENLRRELLARQSALQNLGTP
jgi:hypothetical protein